MDPNNWALWPRGIVPKEQGNAPMEKDVGLFANNWVSGVWVISVAMQLEARIVRGGTPWRRPAPDMCMIWHRCKPHRRIYLQIQKMQDNI